MRGENRVFSALTAGTTTFQDIFCECSPSDVAVELHIDGFPLYSTQSCDEHAPGSHHVLPSGLKNSGLPRLKQKLLFPLSELTECSV